MHIPSSNFKRKSASAIASGVATAAMLWTHVGLAQVPPGPRDNALIENINITGTRIARDGYNMPTPVSVLSEEDINVESPGSVAEFAMTLPSIQGSSTASSSSGSLSAGRAGVAALNLRGLGTGRTLVLLDGQRSVPSSAAGQVDTNTFPQSLVERIEVVSGGASSAYGSDAIAGVVNFILDDDFTGFKSSLEYGDLGSYDAPNEKIILTAGSPIANGDGHILFSAEMYNQEGVHYTAPDWARKGYFAMVNPDDSPGAPHFWVGEDIGISNYTPGGLIVSGPLKGTYFGEGGSVNQLNYGEVGGQWMVGGDRQYTTSAMLGTNSLQADDTRKSVFGRASYELSPSLEAFASGSYASYEGYSHYIRPTDRNHGIRVDNAFLPEEVRSAMVAEGLDSIQVSFDNADMPASGSNNFRATTRFVAGLEGEFALGGKSVGWDTYYQLGETNTDEHQLPTFAFDNLAMATDAVFHPETGEIVCRSSLAMPGNGCVPLNRFGVGVASEEGLDYVLGRPRREQVLQQDVAAINFTTSDFQGWAGPISLAVGAEWRREQIDGEVDPKYISGWKYGNYKVTSGKYTVREAYAETVIPLMEYLEFNGAARRTEYSTSGGVNTWKAGLTYSPMEDLTFRLTKSKDIRAPNLSELFDAGTARTNAVAINGQSVPFIQNLQGTPTVGPEEADAFGFGVIVQPSFLPGFAMSVDYYDIEIDGVIDFLGAEEVADACVVFGVQSYCDQMNYDANGVLQTIDLKYENLNSYRAEGYDVETSYAFPLGSGDVSLRALATHYVQDTTDDGVTAVNSAGSNTGDTPDWVYRFTARYLLNDWTFNLTGRGHSDGVIDNAYIECTSDCPPSVAPNFTINDNSVPGEWYFDAYISKNFFMNMGEGELFLSVKNVFDTDPVLVGEPGRQGGENTPAYFQVNRGLSDMLGRNFRAGMRLEF